MKPRYVILAPFSRPWWAVWWADVRAGRPVGFVAAQARRGKGRVVRAEDRPPSTAAAMLVPITVGSDDFAAWSRHLEGRGIRLPRPDKAPVVWCPSPRPDAAEAA